MVSLTEKHSDAIDDAVHRLISRASDSRGLSAADIRPRIVASLEKYIARSESGTERPDIVAFVDEIRPDDLFLVAACERGDERAWEDLVANFDSTVRSAARKMTSNAEDAEDLASSIWAELYGLRQDAEGNKKSKLGYYSGRGSLAGWLRAVVSQLAVDEFRKQAKFVQIEENREFENLAESASNNSNNEQVLHHADDPEQLLTEKRMSADVSAALRDAMAGLEAEDKVILKLYYFDELKLKEIGAAFGYHEATASRKLVRIQAEIRRSVERSLKKEHGWSDGEVKKHLSETAESLGISLEKMIAVFVLMMVLQDFYW